MKRLMDEIQKTRNIVKRAEETEPYISTFDPQGGGHQGPEPEAPEPEAPESQPKPSNTKRRPITLGDIGIDGRELVKEDPYEAMGLYHFNRMNPEGDEDPEVTARRRSGLRYEGEPDYAAGSTSYPDPMTRKQQLGDPNNDDPRPIPVYPGESLDPDAAYHYSYSEGYSDQNGQPLAMDESRYINTPDGMHVFNPITDQRTIINQDPTQWQGSVNFSGPETRAVGNPYSDDQTPFEPYLPAFDPQGPGHQGPVFEMDGNGQPIGWVPTDSENQDRELGSVVPTSPDHETTPPGEMEPGPVVEEDGSTGHQEPGSNRSVLPDTPGGRSKKIPVNPDYVIPLTQQQRTDWYLPEDSIIFSNPENSSYQMYDPGTDKIYQLPMEWTPASGYSPYFYPDADAVRDDAEYRKNNGYPNLDGTTDQLARDNEPIPMTEFTLGEYSVPLPPGKYFQDGEQWYRANEKGVPEAIDDKTFVDDLFNQGILTEDSELVQHATEVATRTTEAARNEARVLQILQMLGITDAAGQNEAALHTQDGKPVFQYKNTAGKTVSIPATELEAAFQNNPKLYTTFQDLGKEPVFEIPVAEDTYAFQPNSFQATWRWNPELGHFYMEIPNVQGPDGTPLSVFESLDGKYYDANGNPISDDILSNGLTYATNEVNYTRDGKQIRMPLGLPIRQYIDPDEEGNATETWVAFDPETKKRISDFSKYQDYVSVDDVTDVPTFRLPSNSPYTTMRYRVKQDPPTTNWRGVEQPPTYTIVGVVPNGTEYSLGAKYSGLSADKVREATRNKNVDTKSLYPLSTDSPFIIKGTTGTHITVESDPQNPREQIWTLHAGNTSAMRLDPSNPYHAQIIRSVINDPSYTMGPDGPMTHTLQFGNGGKNVQLVSTPYTMTPGTNPNEQPVQPVVLGVTPEVENDSEEDEQNQNEQTIFTDEVKKYIALGIPIGLAVSLALWAVGGAKSEGLLGALAAGAGGGALLGGLGGHLGWFGEGGNEEEGAGEEAEGGSEVAETVPGT